MQADVRDKARELSALEGLVMRYQSELSNLAMQASSREADGEELVASVGKRGCVEVWENQRFYHVMGWSTQLLATDRYAHKGAVSTLAARRSCLLPHPAGLRSAIAQGRSSGARTRMLHLLQAPNGCATGKWTPRRACLRMHRAGRTVSTFRSWRTQPNAERTRLVPAVAWARLVASNLLCRIPQEW